MALNLEEMENCVILKTAVGIENGTPVFKPRIYPLNSDSVLPGNGIPMELEFLRERIMRRCQTKIDNYNSAVRSKDDAKISIAGNENVAITLGKESLMLLLSQADCEGIRFYFCENPWGRDSVAAVGVKKLASGEVKDIGIDNGDSNLSILKATKFSAAVMNMEVGPPNTVADLFEAPTDPFLIELKGVFNIK